jgi:hypothetical protein
MKWVLTCLSLICLAVGASADSKWTKIEPKDGNCEIEFPGKPTEEIKDKDWHYSLRAQSDTANYLLHITELSNKAPLDQPDAVKKIFDQGQTGLMAAKSLEGNKLVKSEDGKFGKYPARDVELSVPKLGTYRVKFVLTGDKFYQITAAGPEQFVKSDDVKKFVDSFKIKD